MSRHHLSRARGERILKTCPLYLQDKQDESSTWSKAGLAEVVLAVPTFAYGTLLISGEPKMLHFMNEGQGSKCKNRWRISSFFFGSWLSQTTPADSETTSKVVPSKLPPAASQRTKSVSSLVDCLNFPAKSPPER